MLYPNDAKRSRRPDRKQSKMRLIVTGGAWHTVVLAGPTEGRSHGNSTAITLSRSPRAGRMSPRTSSPSATSTRTTRRTTGTATRGAVGMCRRRCTCTKRWPCSGTPASGGGRRKHGSLRRGGMRKPQSLDYNHDVKEVRPVDYGFADTILWSPSFLNCVSGIYRSHIEKSPQIGSGAINQFRCYLALLHAGIREMNEEERLCTTQNSTR